MTTWITKSQLVALTGWTPRHIRRQAREGKLRSRENGKQREFDSASLPASAQLALARQMTAAADRGPLNGATALATTAQASLFSASAPSRPEQLAIVNEEDRALAMQRYQAIAPILDFRARANATTPRIVVGDAVIETLDALVAWIAQQNSTTARTLYRWDAQYRKHGLPGLVGRLRADKGQSRFFAQFPKAAEFVANKYLNERLSVRLCAEALAADWQLLYNHGSRPPSYTTVREYLNTLPTSVRTLGREGETAFKNKCAPFVLRDYRSVAVNQVWVSDHMQHDVFVRNDLLPGAPPNAPIRPYLTAIMDVRSRKTVGFCWCVNPSSQSIASAIRVAVTRFGLPETFYMDNGKDYKKVGKQDELCEAASGLLTRLGVKSVHAIPKHPQSKPIERWFGTLHARLDARFSDFYCGPSPDRRPEACELALREHREFLLGKRNRSPLPPASEFIRMAALWIEEEYNQTHPHSGHGMNGRAPDEIFGEELPAAAPHSIDVRELEPLFWDRQRRTLMEGGCVQIFNHRFEPADGPSAAALRLHHQREVLVACDPLNVGDALAFDLDGRYLGALVCSQLVAWGPVSRDAIRAAKRDEHNFRRAVKNYLDGLAQLRSGDQSEAQRLRRRAQLPEVITAEDAAAPQSFRLPRAASMGGELQSYTEDAVEEVRELMNKEAAHGD